MGFKERLKCRILPILWRTNLQMVRRFFSPGIQEGAPADAGRLNEGIGMELVEKICAVTGTMLLIITLCVVAIYFVNRICGWCNTGRYQARETI